MTTTNKPQTQLGIDIIHLLEMSKLPVMKCNKRVIISMKYLWVAKEGEFPICSGQLLNLQNASVSFYPTYGNFLHVSFTFSFSRSSAAWGSTRSPLNLWLHSMFLYVILQGFFFFFCHCSPSNCWLESGTCKMLLYVKMCFIENTIQIKLDWICSDLLLYLFLFLLVRSFLICKKKQINTYFQP